MIIILPRKEGSMFFNGREDQRANTKVRSLEAQFLHTVMTQLTTEIGDDLNRAHWRKVITKHLMHLHP